MKRAWPIFFFLILTIFLFKDFIFKGLLPIPSDIIVGGYYPWRDEIWQGKIAGFPIKNFEIFDSVRQLYPWRWFSLEEFRNWRIPLWNPYNFTGTPHLANILTASFYPLNILFLIMPFYLAWSTQIFLQPFLVGLTTFFFLRNLKIKDTAAFFGSVVFAFSSVLMMRLEFGILGQAALWLPLSLLAVDRFFQSKRIGFWFLAVLALSLSFLAGYFQVTIYTYLLFGIYSFYRFLKTKDKKLFGLIILAAPVAFCLAGIQTIPLLGVILKSSRLGNYGGEAFFSSNYFLPWQRLITFLVPDFFGNTATGNFWGKISYYEFSGYVGVISVFFVFYSLFWLRKKAEVLFWWIVILLVFLFLLPTSLAKLPYDLKIPGFSVLVPARMIFIIDFALAILAAFGFQHFTQKINKEKLHKFSFWAILLLVLCFVAIMISFFFGWSFLPLWHKNAIVSLRNLILPLSFLIGFLFLLVFYLNVKNLKLRKLILVVFILVLFFDLSRQALKYNSFTSKEILFPNTEVIGFLQEQKKDGPFRIQITHQELMPSNFNIFYGLEMIDGYDSFHSSRFEELSSTANSGNPKERFEGSMRSLFLSNHRSPLFDLMNVKYILAIEELKHPNLKLVFKKGKTKVYEDLNVYPRVYLSSDLEVIKNDEEILTEMLVFSQKGERKVVLEEEVDFQNYLLDKEVKAEIKENKNQSLKIKTQAPQKTILVLSDAYDSGWQAKIDGQLTKIYRANYNFRAVIVPKGEHQIVFQYKPRSFKIGVYLSGTTSILLIFSGLVVIRRKKIKK